MGLKEELERAKCYALETINKDELVKLNFENVAKIEAIIKIDSRYRNAGDIEKAPDDEYIKFIKNDNEYKKKRGANGGSGAYWINKLVEIIKNNKKESTDGYTIAQVIKGIVCMLDKENSTHLNSTKSTNSKIKLEKKGRKNVTEIITEMVNKKEIEELLKNPKSNNYEIINKIANGKNEPDEKTYYSFATKFCHYVCLQMFRDKEEEDNFSSYDKYVSANLSKYYKHYVGKEMEKLKRPQNNFGEEYKRYIGIIDEIREAAKVKEEEKIKISRNGIDHLLWYFHKGE